MNSPKRHALFFAGLILAGCQSGGKRSLPTYEKVDPPYVSSGDQTGYDGLLAASARASAAVDASLPKFKTTVSFTESQRALVSQVLIGPMNQARLALQKPVKVEFRLAAPDAPRPELSGWNWIGRAFAFRLAQQLETNQLDAGLETFLIASRFGMALQGGDVLMADLGVTIADDARIALMPYLARMSPAQLWRLSQQLKQVLANQPPLKSTLAFEARNMRMRLQWMQDQAQKGDFAALEKAMDADAGNTVQYLKANFNRDKGEAYFKGLSEECEQIISEWEASADKPARRRELTEFDSKRIWRKPAMYFFGTIQPYVNRRDTLIARSRLLVMTCVLRRSQLMDQPYPSNLDKFSDPLRRDPFSGDTMPYLYDGIEPRLYSVGKDMTDNGGETDASGSAPDLILEPF